MANEPAAYDLETLAGTVHYNEWIYATMRPFLGERVLELGCGTGNLTPLFLRDGRSVLATDIDPRMLFRLQTNLGVRPGLTVRSCAVQELVPELAGSFDSVVSSNVLEHIPDDAERAVIRATYELLKSGGTSIHWVPACPSVFGALDRSFGHQRRYTKAGLAGRFEQAGFKVVKCRYWNSVGLAGWWWQGKARKAQHIRPSAALCYDRFVVPVLRRVEPWVWLPAGQSLCIVARKP